MIRKQLQTYAVSEKDAEVRSAGRFALSQTFARQRPKNGATRIIENAIALKCVDESKTIL